MAVNVKVGSFTRPAAGTTNTVVTGLGFAPTAVIFLLSHALTAGTWRGEMQVGMHVSTGGNGAGFTLVGDNAESFPSVLMEQRALLRMRDASGGVATAFQVSAGGGPLFNSDGFTINWDDAPYDGEQEHIAYLALGGDATPRWVSYALPAGLTVGQEVAIPLGSDPNGTPNAVLMFANQTGDDYFHNQSFGVVDERLNQWVTSFASDQFNVDGATNQRLSTDRIVHCITPSDGSTLAALRITAITPAAMTAEVIVAPPETLSLLLVSISGIQASAGTFAKDTGGAPDAQTVSVVGKPSAALFATVASATIDANVDHIRGAFGVSDGTAHRAVAFQYQEGVSTANSDTLFSTTAALVKANNTTPAVDAASAATFAGDAINLSWNPNDGTATRFAYLTFAETTPLAGHSVLEFNAPLATMRLRESHALTGASQFRAGPRDTTFLGNSSVGTHFIIAPHVATLSTDSPDAPLRLDYTGKLAGTSSMAFTSSHTWPAQSHALAGTSLLTITTPNTFLGSIGADLAGSSILDFTSGTPRLRVGGAMAGTSLLTFLSDAYGLSGSPLPEPLALEAHDLVGTVNLFRNPDFELSTAGATGLASATLAVSEVQAWHGDASLLVTLANAEDSGVQLDTLRGLPYEGKPYGFLAQFQIRAVAEISHTLTARSRVVYTDATSDAGPEVAWGPTPADDWLRIKVPAAVSDPAKQVSHVETDITRATADSGEAFYVDAVQQELDRGQGHTPWAVGSFGEPYHRWQGSQQASITIRDAIPFDFAAPAMTGVYHIEQFLYRADANNRHYDDLSEYVVNATVTADAGRDISWTLDCEMTGDGYRKLRPLIDWLAPYMRVTLPDGTVREGQLGHFVLLPSPRTVSEWDETVQVDARSAEFLLQTQGTKGFMTVREGTRFRRALAVLLDNCHIGREDGRFRYALPDPKGNDRARRDMEWEKKADAGLIANDLARKAGWKPLYATKTGVLTTVNRKKRRMRRMAPVRVWAANLPEDVSIDPWIKRQDATDNEVVGTIEITPRLRKLDDNKIVVVSVNPKKGNRIRAVRYITDPDHPMNPRKKKRIKERKVEMDVGSNADAEALAEAIAEELGTKIDTVTFGVLPDPETEFLRQVVYLAIYTQRGEPVAVGRYAIKSVVYGFTDDEALMQVTAGFVHSVNQLETNDPTGFELVGEWEVA